jgi:hypothetical protein
VVAGPFSDFLETNNVWVKFVNARRDSVKQRTVGVDTFSRQFIGQPQLGYGIATQFLIRMKVQGQNCEITSSIDLRFKK